MDAHKQSAQLRGLKTTATVNPLLFPQLSTMPGAWCVTREQYHQLGMDFVHAMSCDDD